MLTEKVLDLWKPVVANALEEWVKQRMLSMVLSNPPSVEGAGRANEIDNAAKIVTTQEELDSFALIQKMLGPERPVAYEDTTSYFKVHLPERNTWAICRLQLDRKRPLVSVPMALEQVQQLAPSFPVTVPQLGWSAVTLNSHTEIENLRDLFIAAWTQQRALRPVSTDTNSVVAVAAAPVPHDGSAEEGSPIGSHNAE